MPRMFFSRSAGRCGRPWPRPLRQIVAGRLVLRPTREPVDHGDQIACMLDNAGHNLACFIYRTGPGSHRCLNAEMVLAAPPPELLVLKLPGTEGRAERSTPMPGDLLPEIQTEIWTWNPPGYGRSSGRASLRSIPSAAIAFFDAVVARRQGLQTRVWISGNSLGCALACHVAGHRQADGLLLRNPPPLAETIERVAAQTGPRWLRPLSRRTGRWFAGGIPASLDIYCTAAESPAPAIFLQSDEDQLVPPAAQERVRERYKGPWRLIRMAGLQHHDPPTPEHLQQLTKQLHWLWGAEQHLSRTLR